MDLKAWSTGAPCVAAGVESAPSFLSFLVALSPHSFCSIGRSRRPFLYVRASSSPFREHRLRGIRVEVAWNLGKHRRRPIAELSVPYTVTVTPSEI